MCPNYIIYPVRSHVHPARHLNRPEVRLGQTSAIVPFQCTAWPLVCLDQTLLSAPLNNKQRNMSIQATPYGIAPTDNSSSAPNTKTFRRNIKHVNNRSGIVRNCHSNIIRLSLNLLNHPRVF